MSGIVSDQPDDPGITIDQESPRLESSRSENTSDVAVPRTPSSRQLRRSKRVRFSDPGPRLEQEDDNEQSNLSTGLTPFVSRTTLGPGRSAKSASRKFGEGGKRRGRSRRRHTAPNFNTRLSQLKEEETLHSGEAKTFQYLPFHDIIDLRSKRRMGRSGFSQEMNEIESKRKDQKKIQRQNEEELTRLKEELDLLRNAITQTSGPEQVQNSDQNPSTCTTPVEMNTESPSAQTANTPSLASEINSDSDGMEMSAFGIMDEDDGAPLTPQTPSLSARPIDACTQASIADPVVQCQIDMLNKDIEHKNGEELRLFKEWQNLVHSTDAAPETTSPPADLTTKVISTLQAITARESETTESMKELHNELSSHGFDGANASEVIAQINARFREARMELERAVPGETANVAFANWRDIIDALVNRIYHLVQKVTEVQSQVDGCEDRERALRRQFDATLVRMEEASKKNQGLERYSDSIAEDMLNMRMTLQGLEKDLESQDRDKTRLHGALNKYRDDLSMCEKLNSKLEDELEDSSRKSEKLEKLNSRLKGEVKLRAEKTQHLKNNLVNEQELVQSLKSSLDQRNLELSDVRTRIQQLENEKNEILAVLEIAKEQSQDQEKEVELLNTHLAVVATSLNEAEAENETLQSDKASLEDHLGNMKRLFSTEAIQQAHKRANETAKEFAEWQRGVELLDQRTTPKKTIDNGPPDYHSFSTIGSEPMTPASVPRFKHVEFGRGKKRKRCPDSIIGTLTEEEE